jgi:hypothetical protein
VHILTLSIVSQISSVLQTTQTITRETLTGQQVTPASLHNCVQQHNIHTIW